MKLQQITANLWQATRFGLINAYLVLEDDGLTVVDTGIGGTAKGILAAAAAAGKPIKRILLTHGHGDHVGSVDSLMAQLPGISLAISARDARLLRKDTSLNPDEPQTKIKGSVPGTKAVPDAIVTDGELYGSLRCIATPGHTPGHFSFVDERDGTLLAGDALVTVGGKLRTTVDCPWYFLLPQVATWHKPTALRSVAKLLEFPIARVAPGHGRLVATDRASMQAVFEAAARRIKA